jgi:hypothetical protein
VSTPAEPSRRTRLIAIIAVFAVLALGLAIGIPALIAAAGSRPEAQPTPTPTSTSQSSGTQTDTGFIYHSGQYGYSVKFPDEPGEQSHDIPVGDATVTNVTAVWADSVRTLASSSATYPPGSLKDVDASLKSSLTTAVDAIAGASLASSDPYKLDGMEAVKANILLKDGVLRVIIAIDGDTQFQLIAQNTDQPTAEGFFASFTRP